MVQWKKVHFLSLCRAVANHPAAENILSKQKISATIEAGRPVSSANLCLTVRSMSDNILISNGSILTMAENDTELIADGYLSIKAGKIEALGRMDELPAVVRDQYFEHRLEARGRLIMPGLINGHTHGAMTLFRGLADDLPLHRWLHDHIFPAEARHVTPEMVYWCSKLAAAEMILSGTTTCCDGYFYEDSAARAFMETGLRAVAAQGIVDFPAPGVADPAANIKTAAEYIQTWQQQNDRLTPAVFAHSPYTCSPDTLTRAKQLATDRAVPFFIHLAETSEESRKIHEQQGTSVVRYLDSLNMLDRNTICIHCVWLEPGDVEFLAQREARVVTCPSSNMKLASGIAPVAALLAAGVRVGLGTDGSASNNTLNLFTEMNLCAKLHKVHSLDPTLLQAKEVLQMATCAGAQVLGLEDHIGSLAPGKKADLIMIDLRQPHLVPFYNTDLLVYGAAGADVTTVIINGELVMHQRKMLTFDLEETMARVLELSRAVLPLALK
jgi:5-methylthioadenosine/S-adenosylhomocysteine deaminase